VLATIVGLVLWVLKTVVPFLFTSIRMSDPTGTTPTEQMMFVIEQAAGM
jgi:hypothetical protein